ncbi:MAG TPA: chemotaxis protein CheW [Polyangiaceae bacterium]|nr:chemotaxis protein CheW [Polyangiaceae bacterium]
MPAAAIHDFRGNGASVGRSEGCLVKGDSASEMNVLCRAGARMCALPVADVIETLRPLPITSIASMPRFVLGLSIVRGGPVPVVDAQCLLGGAASFAQSGESDASARLVMVRVKGSRRVALRVDEVVGVRPIARAALVALPGLLCDAGDKTVSAVGALDADLLLVLDAARLVTEAVWTRIQAERAEG